MGVNYNTGSVVRDNLQFFVDTDNIKLCNVANNTYTDLITSEVKSGANSLAQFTSQPWSQSMTELTAGVILTVDGTSNTYAYHPMNKWNGTAEASFVLYHFQYFTGQTTRLHWYANRGGAWGTLGNSQTVANNETYHVVIQFNSVDGGQMWINGVKVGGRSGTGNLASTSSTLNIQNISGIQRVHQAYVYDVELTDAQIIQNFEISRGRFGL